MLPRAALAVAVLALCGCEDRTEAGPGDAGSIVDAACKPPDGAECCDGARTGWWAKDPSGCDCWVYMDCRSGHWGMPDSECRFYPPCGKCPPVTPDAGGACTGTETCTYPCGAGGLAARCTSGRWTVGLCSTVGDGTTGKPCSGDAECDVTGRGLAVCSSSGTTTGDVRPFFPSPVCISELTCTPSSGAPASCDGDRGVCLTDNVCWPACRYRDAVDPPTGCVGNDGCHHVGVRVEADGTVTGVGACGSGCRKDEDCPPPRVCQREKGTCETKRLVFTKKPLEGCTGSDVSVDGGCACYTDAVKGAGYCADFCRVGEGTCPAGTLCDPLLPGPSAAHPFTSSPAGMAGFCLAACASDAECPAAARCVQGGGLTTKTCRYGV